MTDRIPLSASPAMGGETVPDDLVKAYKAAFSAYLDAHCFDSGMISFEASRAGIGAVLSRLDAAEPRGWQPMDTAPRDGTIVNVVARYPDATAGFPRYAGFNEEMGCWVEYSRHLPEPVVPLVWRPREDWPQFQPAIEGGTHDE